MADGKVIPVEFRKVDYHQKGYDEKNNFLALKYYSLAFDETRDYYTTLYNAAWILAVQDKYSESLLMFTAAREILLMENPYDTEILEDIEYMVENLTMKQMNPFYMLEY